MKKSLFFAGLAAALSLVGCNKEADVKGLDGRPVEIVLSDVATRTVNDGMSTKWENGDALNVFVAPAGSTEYSANTKFEVDDAANNHAKGTAELTADAYDWYLLYPYSSYIKTPANTGSGYIPVGSKSNEKQAQAGLNSMAHLSGENLPVYGVAKNVARDETPVVSMKHVASVVAINLTNATSTALKVDEVSFTASQDIVGTYYIDFSQETLAFKGSGNNYVSNTASLTVSGDETIAAGASAKFYLAIKPFTAKGQDKLVVKVHSGELVFEKEVTLPTAVEFKSGVIKQLNVTYTGGSETQSSTLAEIAAMDNGADVQTNEVLVVAKYARGIMLAENGSYLLAFNSDGVTGEVGDIVTVSGKVGEYAGLKQIASPEVTVVSSGNEVVLPAPKVIANLDDYASDKVELIQFTGTLAASDKYFNVSVTGSTRLGSIQYPLDTDALKALDKKPITATGFFTGITGGGNYVNMMSTSVEEAAVALFGVEARAISVPATATSAEIKVTGNVDWTVTPGDGILSATPLSGNGEGIVTVTFAANETAEPKEFAVKIGTSAAVDDDEIEVIITQAKSVAGTVLFNETFDQIKGTGGRDNAFSGQIASNDFKDADETWEVNDKVYGAFNCAKYGTSSVNGVMTTRSIALTGDAVLTFYAAGWGSGTNTLSVTASGATLSGDTSITLVNSTWGLYSVDITGASGAVTLTFTGKRGFIDDVKVTSNSVIPPAEKTLVSIAVTGQKTEFAVGDDFTHDTAVVTASYSDNTTKDVTTTSNFSTPDMTTAGTKEVTVSYTEGDVTMTAKYDITVNAAATHAGTADDPYTVAEAMAATEALGEGKTSSEFFYTKGIISEISEVSLDYGNATYFISDDGTTATQFKVYHGRFVGSAAFTAEDQIKIGDEVVIYGKLQYYKPNSGNSELEISSGNNIYTLTRSGSAVHGLSATINETSIGSAAAELTLKVFGDVDWTVSATNGATVNPASGNGIGEVSVSIPANTTSEEKNYTVSVATTASVSNNPITLTIKQGGQDGSEWVATPLAQITASDVFVIVSNHTENGTYAMTNNNGTGSAPAAKSVTVVDGKLSGTPDETIQWKLGGSEGAYVFYVAGDNTKWLYVTNSNNGVRVGTSQDNTFSIKDDYLFNNGQSRYLGVYNKQDWRSYTSINNNIKDQTFTFYVKK